MKNSSFKRIETVVPTSIVQGEPFLVTYKLYVTDEEPQNITDLAIIGPLNTEDIKLIRKMSGYSDQNLPVTEWQGGNLSNLDLRGATITKDKNPFLSIKSSETWTYTESNNAGYYHHSTYNMASMSDKEW